MKDRSGQTTARSAVRASAVGGGVRRGLGAGAVRVGGVVGGFARSFLPRSMPPMARRNYGWELASSVMMPAVVACVEGNVVGVIAKKGFIDRLGADAAPAMNYVVAALAAAGPLANVTSVVWTRVFHGRDRVRCTNVLQVGAGLCVLGMAFAPVSGVGLAMLVVLTLVARALMTGIMVGRSDVWRGNYPRHLRARATGRITMVATLMVSVTAMVIAGMMDVESLGGDGFRWVYIGSIVVGLGGVWAYSRIRWRGRGQHLAREREISDEALMLPGPRSMLRVLRNDRFYRRFMVAQFVLGAPNLAATAVFIIALQEILSPSYTKSILLTFVIPMVMPLASIPLWSRMLDRMHVVRFRMYHSWFFVCANFLMGAAFLTGAEWVLVLSRVVLGVAFGGGMLAWQLGHHDFATRELASIYMGIHATLTGVRGFIAPFVGTMVYLGFEIGSGGAALVVPGLGAWTFVVLGAVGTVAALQFALLSAELKRDGGGGRAPGD